MTTFPSEPETIVALKRMKTWPKEWHKAMLELPANEAKVIVDLVALLDARPHEERSEA